MDNMDSTKDLWDEREAVLVYKSGYGYCQSANIKIDCSYLTY